MSVIWRKVWFDLWANKIRTSLAVLSIAAGVFAIGAVFGMVDQLLSGMDQAHQAIVPSHIWMTLNKRIDQGTADRLKHIKGVEDIEVTNEVAVRYKLKPEGQLEPNLRRKVSRNLPEIRVNQPKRAGLIDSPGFGFILGMVSHQVCKIMAKVTPMTVEKFKAYLSSSQLELFSRLNSPASIQAFLDDIPYSAENANRCPLSVLQDRQAHCLDGGLFAAAALRRLGYPPLIIDLLPEPGMDDDHVLALYQRDGFWGAVAKSNYVGLRFREAIYRNLRELVLSYFEDYYNIKGQKTLRGYTRPLNLQAFDKVEWMWRNEGADAIEQRLGQLKPVPLLNAAMIAGLSEVDKLSFEAGMLGINPAGIYQPKVKRK